jgi:thiol-disulfide isomerase/thioredoxin
MRGRLSIVAGLVVGVVAAGLLLGGIVALAPDGSTPTGPTPTPLLASPSPSSSASPTAAPSSSASPSPSGSASPASSGSAFRVGQPAPPLVVPQVGGGTIDLASLKGKPVWINFMATWCPSWPDEFPLMSGFSRGTPPAAWS